jgi:hypothetical protein
MGPLSYKSAPMEVEAIEWDQPTPTNAGAFPPFFLVSFSLAVEPVVLDGW